MNQMKLGFIAFACILLISFGCLSTSNKSISLNESISGDCVKNHSFKECVDACILSVPIPSGSIYNQCYHNSVEKELELLTSRGCPQSNDDCLSIEEFRRIANESCNHMTTFPGQWSELGDDYKQDCFDIAERYGSYENKTGESNYTSSPVIGNISLKLERVINGTNACLSKCESEYLLGQSLLRDKFECKEQCYDFYARQINSTEYCNKILEMNEQFENVSPGTEWYKATFRTETKQRWSGCIRTICDAPETAYDKASCYSAVAEQLKDVDVCDNILILEKDQMTAGVKKDCITTIANALKDPSICERIKTLAPVLTSANTDSYVQECKSKAA